ncbi:MAG: UDP-N-acetylmuramate--L-alanine ligase [Verrucomicrobiia bacterium]|jgi:UDP-N-acetylmuramate--L-alanine ligase/UDP-N-acetylenolpyruvoylglucosamine reductase
MGDKQQLIEFLGSRQRRVHFVGVGGCGMSGLARLLLQQGHRVTGSDMAPNGGMKELQKLGARIYSGHATQNISEGTELVVYTSAVGNENVELQAAAELKIPRVRRGLLLSALMNHPNNIAVAGTHGKTTTTAMIAYVLTRSDSAPSYCVGAHVPVLGANAQIGGGKYFVAETDESDGTLVGFSPEYSVCLNIEPEHLDHYGSMDKLRETFEAFFASTHKTVFLCADCTNCLALAPKCRTAISFGLSPRADYRALNVEQTKCGSRFTVSCRDQQIGVIELTIPGIQNVTNALATVAVADELGVPFERIADALQQFTGAARRFDRRYDEDGILVVDDYAHHPTEIRATIAAARTMLGKENEAGYRRLVVAFQPHRYTRTQALLEEFGSAFAGAGKLFLTDIYAASEKPIEGINGRMLHQAVVSSGQSEAVFEPDLEMLVVRLFAEARRGDLILTMGAGDMYKVAEALTRKLRTRRPNVLTPEKQPQRMQADWEVLLSVKSKIRRNEPMSRHTSMRVGGPAEFWVEPADERDLARLLHYCHVREIPVTVMGRGTNLLVLDGGIRGVVISLSNDEFTRIEVDGERLVARAGARLKAIVAVAARHQLSGLEFMEGIPGSLGGALRMNAGAMGRQTFDVVEWVRYISYAGDTYDAEAKSLPVTYRSCPVFHNHIALSAILRGTKAERKAIDNRLKAFAQRRWASQPAKPSAGCIFKNPERIPAGKLIEELGLKGMSIGGARVSEVHGNFIVNEGRATASDVMQLIAAIRQRARQERGIDLEPEVMILGAEKQ